LQRNTALQWMRNNLKADTDRGVIYFADDDNSYGLEVFEEVYLASNILFVTSLIFHIFIYIFNILHKTFVSTAQLHY
jgi:hypothetical protein